MSVSPWLGLAAILHVCTPSAVPAEWPDPEWTPEMAMQMRVAEINLRQLDLPTALCLLDNHCGLVFGYADLRADPVPPRQIDLVATDVTVGEIVEKLRTLAADHDFYEVDGVPVVVRKSASGEGPPVLKQVVPELKAANVGLFQFKDQLMTVVGQARGAPPMLRFGHEAVGAGGIPRVTLHLTDVTVEELLCKASALIGQSWLLRLDQFRRRASFNIGRQWGLPMNLKYTVRLASDPPQESIPGIAPEPELVRERVSRAVTDGRLVLHQMDSSVAELAALVDDHWAQRYATNTVMDAISLLGAFRAEEAAGVLARNIGVGSPTGYPQFVEMVTRRPPGADATQHSILDTTPDPAKRAQLVHDFWLGRFPALEALHQIGEPAVPWIIDELAIVQIEAAPGTVEPPNASDEREGKVMLLCEALRQVLGSEAAVQRLQGAALDEEDADRARRLREAADRISEGLVPKLE